MNRFFKVFWPWLMVPVFWLVVGLLLFAMCGCARVQYVPVETVRVDSVYGVRWFSDSTFLKDSIYIELRAERDTVNIDIGHIGETAWCMTHWRRSGWTVYQYRFRWNVSFRGGRKPSCITEALRFWLWLFVSLSDSEGLCTG